MEENDTGTTIDHSLRKRITFRSCSFVFFNLIPPELLERSLMPAFSQEKVIGGAWLELRTLSSHPGLTNSHVSSSWMFCVAYTAEIRPVEPAESPNS